MAAWLLPGLGHVLVGQKARGLVIFAAVMTLWTMGLLIGGISVIEVKSEAGEFRPWYLGQMLVSPSLLVDWQHQHLRNQHRAQEGAHGGAPRPDDDHIPYTPAIGRTHEIGTLYTALAGLLNLLAILHVAYQEPRPLTARTRSKP